MLEIVAGLTIGQFLPRGRAEVAIFLAFRPWLLLALTLLLRRRPLGERWRHLAAFILVAGTAEALLVILLGAPGGVALVEAGRAMAASLALAIMIDLVLTFFARFCGWRGAVLGMIAGVALLLTPGTMMLFERAALRGETAAPADRPPLLLLTGLPMIWGEGSVGDAVRGAAEPGAAYLALADDYAVRPVEALSSDALAGAKLLLVAQPRSPGPAGLVALDSWVRKGGRALILTDPALRWPSTMPLGDPRRPPDDDGLGPLLLHWGLSLERVDAGATLTTRFLDDRRVMMAAPGRFRTAGPSCRIREGGLLADCRIGAGRALLFADADLLHDLLWVGPGEIGRRRAGRLADNGSYLLDRLAELRARPATDGDRVAWIRRPERATHAILAALGAAGVWLLIGLGLIWRRRREKRDEVSYTLIHKQEIKTK